MPARASLILSGLAASSAFATPSIDPQFGDHAVIQRGSPIILSGRAAPNEHVSVRFAGASSEAVADRSGRWRATFRPLPAGGPYRIDVKATEGIASASDLEIGDVWLCSGQSNMEYPLRRALNGDAEVEGASDPELRVMKVPQQLATSPQRQFANPPQWQSASPSSVSNFSAACYFLVRELRASEKVPIGAIDDSWGGTPIRAWMNEVAVRSSGGAETAAIVDVYHVSPTAAIRQFGAQWGIWWRSKTGDEPGEEPWNASKRLTWTPVPSLTYWDDWGPQWKGWIGSIWARKLVTLTASEAEQPATLSLSAVDDIDETFVNGIAVGGKNDPSNSRSYPVPRGVLKAGTNEILVFVRNLWGQGGLVGPADKFSLSFVDRHSMPLGSGWQYSKIADSVGQPPVAPWDGPSGVSTIYGAMVAPLGSMGLKGVVWYQGESDVGESGYDKRLRALMDNWRQQFGNRELPFLIVGLAGWGKPVSHPVESGWASLINEQRMAVEHDSTAALASAIDLGEPNDIHPANKQEVGRRLALAAHRLVYRDGGTFGPIPVSARLSAKTVMVTFSKPLQILGGETANGFELCGETHGSCRYAEARAQGNTVVIMADGAPVSRVRYAWSDYPTVNLYDLDLLPAPVFELQVQ